MEPRVANIDAFHCRLRLKCDGTRAETRFRLATKRTSPFKSAEASVQSTTGSWGVRISGSNTGYSMLRGSVKSTGYSFHPPVSPSLPLQYRTSGLCFYIQHRCHSALPIQATPDYHKRSMVRFKPYPPPSSHQFARSFRNGLLPIAQLWTHIPTPLWYHFYTRQTTGD